MSAININHSTETITTENDEIVKIGNEGALLIGSGDNVSAVGNEGILRINSSTNALEKSNGTTYKKLFSEDDTINTLNIADNAISTAKLQDGSVTAEKLAAALTTNALDKTLNLSDLTNVGDARDNLGLGSAALNNSADFMQSSNNLSDVDNASVSLNNIGGVPTTRQINSGSGITGGGDLTIDRTLSVDSTVVRTTRSVATGSGLLGGGDLSANRTLTPDFALQAEAEAGVSTTKVMSPLRTAQAIASLTTNKSINFYMIADVGSTVDGSSGSTTRTGTIESTVTLSGSPMETATYVLSNLKIMNCYRRLWAAFNSGATYVNCLLEANTESGWIPLKFWCDNITYGASLPTGNLDLYARLPLWESAQYSSRGINGPIVFTGTPQLRLTSRLCSTLPSPIMRDSNGTTPNTVYRANTTTDVTFPSPVASIIVTPVSGAPAGFNFGWYAGGFVSGNLQKVSSAVLPSGGWNMGNPSGSGGHSDTATWIGS